MVFRGFAAFACFLVAVLDWEGGVVEFLAEADCRIGFEMAGGLWSYVLWAAVLPLAAVLGYRSPIPVLAPYALAWEERESFYLLDF
jgi:hypothetical protein